MNIYKYWIIEELESWKQTFNNDTLNYTEEEKEEENNTYYKIERLIKTFSNSSCNKNDYETILFHLWQKNAL